MAACLGKVWIVCSSAFEMSMERQMQCVLLFCLRSLPHCGYLGMSLSMSLEDEVRGCHSNVSGLTGSLFAAEEIPRSGGQVSFVEAIVAGLRLHATTSSGCYGSRMQSKYTVLGLDTVRRLQKDVMQSFQTIYSCACLTIVMCLYRSL